MKIISEKFDRVKATGNEEDELLKDASGILDEIKSWNNDEEKLSKDDIGNSIKLLIDEDQSVIDIEILEKLLLINEDENNEMFIVEVENIIDDLEHKLDHDRLERHISNKVDYNETNYTIKFLISQFEEGLVKMPKYQRSYVWDEEQVSGLILSLLREIPIPKLYGYNDFDEDKKANVKLIIDGQQRLTSILMYYYGVFPKFKIRSRNYSEDMGEISRLCEYYYYPEESRKKAIRLNLLDDEFDEVNREIDEAEMILEKKYKLNLGVEFKAKIVDENNNSKEIDISYRGENSRLTEEEKAGILERELGFVVVKGAKNSETVDIFRIYNSSGTPLSAQEIRNGIHYKNLLYKKLNEYNESTGRIPGTRTVNNASWNNARNKTGNKSDIKQMFLMLAWSYNIENKYNIEKMVASNADYQIQKEKNETIIGRYSDYISINGGNEILLNNDFDSFKNFFEMKFVDQKHASRNTKRYVSLFVILKTLGYLSKDLDYSSISIPRSIYEGKSRTTPLSYLSVDEIRSVYALLVDEGVLNEFTK